MDHHDCSVDYKGEKMGKVMFFDVDGTLFRRECLVPDSTVKAIRKAVDNGHYAFLCTGRGASEMPEEVKALPLHGEVCQCGTYVKVGEEVVVDAAVTGEDCQKIVQILKQYDCPFFIENPDYFYYDSEYIPDGFEKMIHIIKSNYPGGVKTMDELDDRIAKITGYPQRRENIPAIREALSPWFYVIDHEEYDYIEIILNGYTKGTGIEAVMKTMGISREDTYGFGDSMNDIPMLETVGTAVVMGEAPDALKEKYLVTDGIKEDGLANALKMLGLA